jgi:hypothetical protein
MPMFRNVGPRTTIAPGAMHFWEYWFGAGAEVGVTLATPNMLTPQINLEMVTFEHGAVQRPGAPEAGTRIHYTVRVRNNGPVAMDYNLNVGYLA